MKKYIRITARFRGKCGCGYPINSGDEIGVRKGEKPVCRWCADAGDREAGLERQSRQLEAMRLWD